MDVSRPLSDALLARHSASVPQLQPESQEFARQLSPAAALAELLDRLPVEHDPCLLSMNDYAAALAICRRQAQVLVLRSFLAQVAGPETPDPDDSPHD